MQGLLNVLYFILVIGTIVLVHEFGHFIFAKIFGVYVYEFSIGMGPRLFKIEGKETDYSIRLFPVGGYVSLAGENQEDDQVMKNGKKVPKKRRLDNINSFKRLLILVAGGMNNFILAFLLFFFIGLGGYQKMDPVIGVNKGGAAYEAGLKDKDHVTYINHKRTKTIEDVELQIFLEKGKKGDKPLLFTVKRGKDIDYIKVVPKKQKDPKTNKENYFYGVTLGGDMHKDFFGSLKAAAQKLGSNFRQMKEVLSRLVTGKLGIDSFAGPVGIYKIVGDTGEKGGFGALLMLLAIISINIGFMNLLPFPIFDGGKVLYLIIEKFKGSKIDPKTEQIIDLISVILIIAFALIITGQDILRIIK